MAAKIKRGDRVVVISGRDKGKRGEVLEVSPSDFRAVVQGVNLIKKHQKDTKDQKGGIVIRESTIHVSNLSLLDPKDDLPARVGFKFLDDGRKVRFSKRSGELIDA